MAIKRKPGGLKKAAAAQAQDKDKKKDEEAVESQAMDAPQPEEDTLAVPVSGEDEVAEVSAMLELALTKLADADAEAADEGALLLRGVVHESDRIVRVRFANNEEQREDEEALPARFHLAYGSALFRLGLLAAADADADQDSSDSSDNAPVAYLDAAIDRFDTGLDAWPLSWQLHEACARAIAEKANLLLAADQTLPEKEIDALIATAVKHMTAALTTLADTDLDESISIISILLRHAHLRDISEASKKWINIARVELNKLLKFNPAHVPALVTLGQTYMSSANQMLDAAEDDGDLAVDMEAVEKLIDEALKYASKASLHTDVTASTESNLKLQLLLGEAYVNKANLLDEAENEDSANEYYKKAVDCFKKVQEIDSSALPESFDSFLQDWESDMK
ncbi:nuclear pore complex subunit Nro1-domain-containing protein [Obelidium mucronatum]|nr:nuclear pore complex subunit Nro1-domain-containing protein [Obelidium mucronatum]